MANNSSVVVSKLEKKFGVFTAVNKISFEVEKGEIFGFLGPNGAGKSTTIRMLCGIITPTSGDGTVGGFDINNQQEKIKENIGYMSQRFSLYDDLTVEENINFYSGIYRVPPSEKGLRKETIIRLAGLEEFKSRLTKTLSGGWKQRLALGCALIHKPKILFLDEPTSGVDPITRANFWTIIKDLAGKGVTVFVTTHYMDEAENCARLVLIYRGTIVAMGTPEEMKTKFMKKEILKISVSDPEEWLDAIKAVPAIEEIALFGSSMHAVVKESAPALDGIRNLFRTKGLTDYEARKIKPSLEDVFVSLIENYDRENKEA